MLLFRGCEPPVERRWNTYARVFDRTHSFCRGRGSVTLHLQMAGQDRQRQPGIARHNERENPGEPPPGFLLCFLLMFEVFDRCFFDFRLKAL